MRQAGFDELALVALKLQERGLGHSRRRLLPNKTEVVAILRELETILLPGHSGSSRSNVLLVDRLGQLAWRLGEQIHRAVDHVCEHHACSYFQGGLSHAVRFLEAVPRLAGYVEEDVKAAYDGDPAARSFDEVRLAYPGLFAVVVYRMAHVLLEQGVPLIPRMMTEYAHAETGIDIHPGARIGKHFFIDHGTGVVIGETTVIGDDVKIYQGVTLGALSFPRDPAGQLIRSTKRHPTVEDHVTIYAGATILGGETVIGHHAVIGGNVWLTESVPPHSKVVSRPLIEVRQ